PTAMQANTAVAFVAGGVSLLLSQRGEGRARAAAGLLAALVFLLALLTLVEDATRYDLRIDQLLFRELPGLDAAGVPRRMGPNTALAFALLGSALLLLRERRHGDPSAQLLALLANLVAGLAALGYLYWVPELYTAPRYTPMPLQTALTLLIF